MGAVSAFWDEGSKCRKALLIMVVVCGQCKQEFATPLARREHEQQCTPIAAAEVSAAVSPLVLRAYAALKQHSFQDHFGVLRAGAEGCIQFYRPWLLRHPSDTSWKTDPSLHLCSGCRQPSEQHQQVAPLVTDPSGSTRCSPTYPSTQLD